MQNDCTKVLLKIHLTCKWSLELTPSNANKKIRLYFCCGAETELSAALPSVIKLKKGAPKPMLMAICSLWQKLYALAKKQLLSSACYHWIRRMHDYHC